MQEFTATFEIETRTDAHAVERLLARLHDTIREESRTLREGTEDSAAVMSQFASLRDAARRTRPGRLTIVFEQRDEAFDA